MLVLSDLTSCDGTPQVIRPTYSCPCPTDLRQHVGAPESLDKFGICFYYLSQERFTRHADITSIRVTRMQKQLHKLTFILK
jgi:hypothetical protein